MPSRLTISRTRALRVQVHVSEKWDPKSALEEYWWEPKYNPRVEGKRRSVTGPRGSQN
jgi:hypothetical protein